MFLCANVSKNDLWAVGMTSERRETATKEEKAAALRRLSETDLLRLEQLARLRVIGLHAVDWRDLLHEAIVRMLDGSRRWPCDVPLVVFLHQTMRSIASDHWRRLEKPVVIAASQIGADQETGEKVVNNTVDPASSPECRVSAAETLARIREMFRHDNDALRVIAGLATGLSPQEIQRDTGMNETQYASTRRRIRRRLVREFPERGR